MKEFSQKSGCLYIVATPIGNLADITLRALEILKSADLIAAEDTRHSQRLLNFYAINTPLISLHAHNEQQRITDLLPQLQAGKRIALITDAGTPLISDPGSRLVQALHHEKIPVVPIPGPCAAISALAVSGLPSTHFVFEGFLPAKGAAREQRLRELAIETRTIIFYESPHRIEDLLTQLIAACGGERLATLAREMTKVFETIRHAPLADLQQWVSDDSNQRKGEFVVVLQGAPVRGDEDAGQDELQRILRLLLAELPLKQAVALAADITGAKRNRVYSLALTLNLND
jgi:16S rRNA (cytidine1402-2'-O)-methyltransferase